MFNPRITAAGIVVLALSACGGGDQAAMTAKASPLAPSAQDVDDDNSDSQPITAAVLRQRFNASGAPRPSEDE